MKTIKIFLLIALFLSIKNSLAQSKLEFLNKVLENYQEEGSFNGTALVYQNGKIILNKGFGYQNKEKKLKNSENTIFQLGSITKQFTASIILKLEEEKKLKLTDPISYYISEYPEGEKITIHHLLSHTSGVYNYTDNADFLNSKANMPINQKEMLALFKDKP